MAVGVCFEATIEMLSSGDREAPAERVLQLAGAAAALRDLQNTPLWPSEKSTFDRALASARRGLTIEAGEAVWMRGTAPTLDDALGLALAMINECKLWSCKRISRNSHGTTRSISR